MKKIFTLALLLISPSFAGCYVNPADVGRKEESSYEQDRRKQEELILRQQAVIERQQRELRDVERQRLYDQHLEAFDPKE